MIDSHVLAWGEAVSPDCPSMAWMPESLRTTFARAPLDDITADMSVEAVVGVVLSQVCNSSQHTDEQLAMAAASDIPTKVVGWLPLDDPDETSRLIDVYSDNPHLVGVQHRLAADDDKEFLVDTAVSKSLDAVMAAGLSLDIIPLSTESLLLVPDIVRNHPDLRIAVNMLGWPDVSQRSMQPWSDYFTAAGALQSVYFKVCSMHVMGGDLTDVSDMAPYLDVAISIFGAERMMVGSNWPVLTERFPSYGDAASALREAFADCTSGEQHQVMELTAKSFYGFE